MSTYQEWVPNLFLHIVSQDHFFFMLAKKSSLKESELTTKQAKCKTKNLFNWR